MLCADALLADLQTTLHANGANLNDGEETWANESQAQHVTSQSYQYQHGDIDHQVKTFELLVLLGVKQHVCDQITLGESWGIE